jgi:hypothetical protein
LVAERLDVDLLAVDLAVVVEEQRQEAGGDLVLEAPPEGPGAGRVHVDRADVRDEDLKRPPERDVQTLGVPGVVRHVEILKERLPGPRERRDRRRVCPVHGDRRVVVVKG